MRLQIRSRSQSCTITIDFRGSRSCTKFKEIALSCEIIFASIPLYVGRLSRSDEEKIVNFSARACLERILEGSVMRVIAAVPMLVTDVLILSFAKSLTFAGPGTGALTKLISSFKDIAFVSESLYTVEELRQRGSAQLLPVIRTCYI